MKVAVASQGPDLDSPADPRFGRARYFLVVDTETEEFTPHDNSQNMNAAQGAGVQAGRNVVALGVEAVIAGNVGPKAFTTLEAGGVAIYVGAEGSVKDALEQLKAGQLQCASGPSVGERWK